MRIDAIIIDQEPSSYLKSCLITQFPDIKVQGEAAGIGIARRLIHDVNPSLVFADMKLFNIDSLLELTEGLSNRCEMICLSDRADDAITALRHHVCGFILKPLNAGDIVISVKSAIRNLETQTIADTPVDQAGLPHTRLIGIPTMEGIDFIYVHEIIRCEGLQKCTRVVTMRRKSLISSYNIGEFKKLLDTYGFFMCHKSHLINLMHVKRVTREGFIVLSDAEAVPLARRKRLEFLQQLKHL
ncbi:MAG: response regulator transcription factor [Bacteroidia bacterium]|nr:response regulator transcription factor [Bacteroidia bacterium]